jgi:hypothetical protein
MQLGTFTGVWNVTLKQDGTASVSARIFEDGKIHAAWGGQYFGQAWQQADAGGNTFVLTNDGFLMLRFTLDGTDVTYQLTDYCVAMGLGAGSAYVYGELDR